MLANPLEYLKAAMEARIRLFGGEGKATLIEG